MSTGADYVRFLRALTADDTGGGAPLVSPEHRRLLTTDQVPTGNKTTESFFPGFWDGTGWGFGVAVVADGPHRGRFGWSGGQGTDFFVDPDGRIGVLLTQVELGERVWPLVEEFQAL